MSIVAATDLAVAKFVVGASRTLKLDANVSIPIGINPGETRGLGLQVGNEILDRGVDVVDLQSPSIGLGIGTIVGSSVVIGIVTSETALDPLVGDQTGYVGTRAADRHGT